MITAVILAAGDSKRMGQPKLLLAHGERTIIEAVVASVTASKVDATFVVLGACRRLIQEKIRGFPVTTVFNRRYREGMLSSVQAGISSLPPTCRAAVVVLADQPDIPPAVIDSLLDAYTRGNRGIVVPVCRGRRGHPLILDLKYREEVAALSAATGLRGLLDEHPQDILEVAFSHPAVIRDIDTPEDYRRFCRR